MNQIFIFAKFNQKPSNDEIEQIRKEISYFLLDYSSDIELEFRTGESSWWIEIIGSTALVSGYTWIISQFSGYIFKQMMDKVFVKVKERNKIPEADMNEEKSVVELNEIKNFSELEKISLLDSSLAKLEDKLGSKESASLIMYKISQKSGSEFRGYIKSCKETEQGLEYKLHMTDDKEDFDSYS